MNAKAHSIKIILPLLIILCCTLLLKPATALAANYSTNALRVMPAISQIQLTPQQDSATVELSITNLTNTQLIVGQSARDFGSLNNSGALSFFGNQYNPTTNPHGLQRSLQFNSSRIILPPMGAQVVPVTITNATSLAAGGHYGAILFTPLPLNDVTGHFSQVGVHPSVASLLFVVTAAGGTQKVALETPHIGPLRFTLPTAMYLVLSNTGNTQTIPHGQMSLYGPTSRLVSRAIINVNSGLILPDSARLFTTTLPGIHSTWALPGIYTLQVQYRDDASQHFTTMTVHFLYLNPLLVVIALIVAVGGIYIFKRRQQKARKSVLMQIISAVVRQLKRRLSRG